VVNATEQAIFMIAASNSFSTAGRVDGVEWVERVVDAVANNEPPVFSPRLREATGRLMSGTCTAMDMALIADAASSMRRRRSS
jgi:hypothetical protein